MGCVLGNFLYYRSQKLTVYRFIRLKSSRHCMSLHTALPDAELSEISKPCLDMQDVISLYCQGGRETLFFDNFFIY